MGVCQHGLPTVLLRKIALGFVIGSEIHGMQQLAGLGRTAEKPLQTRNDAAGRQDRYIKMPGTADDQAVQITMAQGIAPGHKAAHAVPQQEMLHVGILFICPQANHVGVCQHGLPTVLLRKIALDFCQFAVAQMGMSHHMVASGIECPGSVFIAMDVLCHAVHQLHDALCLILAGPEKQFQFLPGNGADGGLLCHLIPSLMNDVVLFSQSQPD